MSRNHVTQRAPLSRIASGGCRGHIDAQGLADVEGGMARARQDRLAVRRIASLLLAGARSVLSFERGDSLAIVRKHHDSEAGEAEPRTRRQPAAPA